MKACLRAMEDLRAMVAFSTLLKILSPIVLRVDHSVDNVHLQMKFRLLDSSQDRQGMLAEHLRLRTTARRLIIIIINKNNNSECFGDFRRFTL